MRKQYEAEIIEGLHDIALAEVKAAIQGQGRISRKHPERGISFRYEGVPRDLFSLKTVIAVYEVLSFDVPRPKALLGHQHFHRLLDAIGQIRGLYAEDTFQSLHIGAAGSQSSVMRRIQDEISQHLSLPYNRYEGDLLLRIRRPPENADGWQVLVRLTPRPLATRSWRVCNMKGALNATVAQAMIRLLRPTSGDDFLNLASGSGSLLIERAAWGAAQSIVGYEIAPDTLDCAQQNIEASGYSEIDLRMGDVTDLPLPSNRFNTLAADLPFGNLVGSHDDNQTLYPALLQEAARVATEDARFTLITHEIRLMEQLLQVGFGWKATRVLPITLTGLHPRIYVLERTND